MIVEQKLKEIEDLKPGTKFNNELLRELFLCSPQGGMRRSSKTNTLVLICNHIQSIYDDEWKNDVLYYTEMGQTGDQSFYFMQNKTLFQSNDNGVQIHLFEVFKDKEYTYTGKVKLAGKPFTGEQQDSLGKTRVVCIFPLKLLNNRLVLSDDIDSAFSIKEKEARKLSDDELKHRIAQRVL